MLLLTALKRFHKHSLLSEWKETANDIEENFAIGDVAKGDFILVNLAGNRGIYHNIAEVLNDFYELWNEVVQTAGQHQ